MPPELARHYQPFPSPALVQSCESRDQSGEVFARLDRAYRKDEGAIEPVFVLCSVQLPRVFDGAKVGAGSRVDDVHFFGS